MASQIENPLKYVFWQCGTVLTLIAKQLFIFAGIRQERVVGFVDSLHTIKQTKNRVRITYEGSEAGCYIQSSIHAQK
jgi:hypothetical protein